MKFILSTWGRVLGALLIMSGLVVFYNALSFHEVVQDGDQAEGTMFFSPDHKYSLRLPVNWEARRVKDGVAQEHVVIFSGPAQDIKLEVRHFPAAEVKTAYALATLEEAQYVRFQTGYVKGKLVSLPELKINAEVALLEYNFVQEGKPMLGRNYYLRLNQNQFYLLRFNGAAKALQALDSQVRKIVTSFRLLPPKSVPS
jgi:hypothetical protein